MDYASKLAVFQAQTTNVRELERGIRQVRRSINLALRCNDQAAVDCHTRLYAVTFCAWAEANFVKVVCTPYGVDPGEVEQILEAKQGKNGNIRSGWKKAVELGLRHLDARRGNFLPNARQELERAIDRYVFEPAQLRNKLAHGQWMVALNRELTAEVKETTTLIEQLTITQIDGWRTCHGGLARLVETLIESPKRAFVRDWWTDVVTLRNDMDRASKQTLNDHVAVLKRKPQGQPACLRRRREEGSAHARSAKP